MTWHDDFLNAVSIKPYHVEDAGIIWCGDAVEISRHLPDTSVDLMVTDPPYFLPASHYCTRTAFRRSFSDLGILEFFLKEFFKESERFLKEDSSYYMFCDGQSYPLYYYHSYSFNKSVKPIIWDKKTSINGYGWRHQHELILWAERPKAKPIPTGDGDIVRFPAVPVKERDHPAQKPYELIAKLISKSSKEDDIVFDPFLGSGVTYKAAKELGRKFIGIEISEDYCKIAVKRLRQGVLNFGD